MSSFHLSPPPPPSFPLLTAGRISFRNLRGCVPFLKKHKRKTHQKRPTTQARYEPLQSRRLPAEHARSNWSVKRYSKQLIIREQEPIMGSWRETILLYKTIRGCLYAGSLFSLCVYERDHFKTAKLIFNPVVIIGFNQLRSEFKILSTWNHVMRDLPSRSENECWQRSSQVREKQSPLECEIKRASSCQERGPVYWGEQKDS